MMILNEDERQKKSGILYRKETVWIELSITLKRYSLTSHLMKGKTRPIISVKTLKTKLRRYIQPLEKDIFLN
jgi:hypothetical protein